ncbi:hypothetical protein H5410_051545 [Solanum commersonii]|uniref:Uncharacterized protein n=1 Tax=Solanum commersonii TaxID=4109 RepID=A0A9J5X108_SOLCO|nr:hypothetical protein H5410_051545 [Solanum commersonii]
MGIVEVEKHFKTCTFRTDNLGYREEYENQEKFENLEKILENLYDSDDEIERNSIISQKELMESTSSSASPFQRTAQPHTIDTSTGNVPRRRVFRIATNVFYVNGTQAKKRGQNVSFAMLKDVSHA